MKSLLRTFAVFGVFLFSAGTLLANVQSEPVRAELVAEEAAVHPGRPFWVGVNLTMDEGWDTYWKNPGDSGFPTQVEWQLPEGFTAGPLLWPYPEMLVNESLVSFAYMDNVLLMAEITPPQDLAAGENVEIKADVQWLACNESCVPGSASLALSLPVSTTLPSANGSTAKFFSEARSALPQQESSLSVTAQQDSFRIQFSAPDNEEVGQLLFIPEQQDIIDYGAAQVVGKQNNQITLTIKRAHLDQSLETLKGVLLVSGKDGAQPHAIAVDSIIRADLPKGVDGVSSVAVALGLAFIGGLILNVMPCVLPVIALKIFSFVKMAGQRRGLILQHGGVFSLGVVASFWALSGALLILRSYGEGVGWGFQLQEPIFVAVLASLLFLLGLSLFGVFEMGTSLIALGNKGSGTSPLKNSFMSGVLATLVATPCTGPLLGPALGFAVTLPPVEALSIFTAMGLGMAFPYLLFAAFPHLVRFLPKPGNWMVTFKQAMGFLMMATVAWLVWVFGAQTDNMATFVLLGALLAMAIGAWIYGTWGALTRRKMTRITATTLAAAIVFMGGFAVVMEAQHYSAADSGSTAISSNEEWEAFSPERVAQLREEGTPVFVDFTAKWCLICQANKVTLHSSEVQKAFREKGVVMMVADWTKKDPIITRQLENLGRSGVPVYALYPGDVSEVPHILPQTLSASVVIHYLDKLKAPVTAQAAAAHAD